jgi:hypothetical protein
MQIHMEIKLKELNVSDGCTTQNRVGLLYSCALGLHVTVLSPKTYTMF